MIPLVDGDYGIKPGKHGVSYIEDAVFKCIPYCGTVVHARNERTVIATLILPIDNDDEAEAILKSARRSTEGSGNLTVSLVKEGTTHTYSIGMEKGWLVLE